MICSKLFFCKIIYMKNYKEKYIKYKKKYILLKIQRGGFEIGDFVETLIPIMITNLQRQGYRNIYIVRKIFKEKKKINIENIDSPGNIISLNYDNVKKILEGPTEEYEEKEIEEDEEEKIKRIFENYYLATQSRYKAPIDILRPFGSFEELEELYSTQWSEIERIKSMYVDVKDKQIVGTSQYGIYFRLVKKSDIDKHTIYKSDSDNFRQLRSFIFDFRTFLHYISNEYKGIPLFWYSNFNAYGRTKYKAEEMNTILMTDNPEMFVSEINDLEKKLRIHELVCRIPIPLTPETGFIGKINSGIL
jgi:hypothetical protein